MVWQDIFKRFGQSSRSGSRKRNRRGLRLERMERRELMASDLGVIAGQTFVDQGNDGSSVGDPPVLVGPTGNLVSPGTPGAQGVSIELFRDNGTTPGSFDADDDLVGTVVSNLDGTYRFGGLSPDTYFVVQAPVQGLATPDPITAVVVDDDGVRTALIDDFATTAMTLLANAATPNNFQSLNATEAIGGNRDVIVNATGTGSVLLEITPALGQLTVSTGADGTGLVSVQYDGSESTATLAATGLRTGGVGVSLGGGAPGEAVDPDAGVIVLLRAENAGDSVSVIIHSDPTNSSIATIPIPANATLLQEIFIRFSDFAINTGAGADFNDVGAIETSIPITVANNDVFVSIVEAIEPVVVTVNLANIQPLALGGTIFVDNSVGGQNDGVRQGNEAGLTGITVQLFELVGPNDVVDPANQLPIATTTTTTGGAYLFTGLTPGNYATVIPANQFATGAPLFGFANSTGNDPLADPDGNDDGVDDGTTLASGDVVTGTITLQSNLEPIDDDDTDANTNTTLDFGVFPQTDLQITKTLNVAGSLQAAGGNAVFDIVVTNNGPLNATEVVVSDTFPGGLTFAGLANQNGLVANVNGTTVTVPIGNLAAGTTRTFQFLADIGANQTADLTNTATVVGFEVETNLLNNADDAIVDLVSTDVRIEKTDLTDPVNAGNQFTYQITVTNDGPDNATGVVVTDPLPAGVTFISGNVDGAANLVTVDPATGLVTATVGNLANAAASVITIVVAVAPDAVSPLNNTATVTVDPNTDPDLTNNTSDEDTTINRVVDVGVTKTVTGTATAGGVVTYTVAVVNNGPGQARGVTVVDTLDPNLTLVNGSFDPGTSGVTIGQSGQALTFTVGTLAPQQTQTFTFDVMIGSSAFGVIPNTATVSTTDTDNVPANDSDDVNINVGRVVDLILTKDVDLATATPGADTLVYTFTVSHDTDSVSDASTVRVTDTLPAGLAGVVITAPTATATNVTNGVITVDFDTIPVGQTRTFTVTATVNADAVGDANGNIVNPATVTSQGATELDVTNNTDTATTALDPDFDVVVAKTVDNAAPTIGGAVVFTVTLTNDGPSTARNIVLTDAIPAGLTFNNATLNGQAGVQTGSNVSFPGITLAPGATASATLNFTVQNTASGTIINTASIPDLSAAGENDITNNSASANITVTPVVDLVLTKSVNDTTAAAGDTLTYTVNVVNNGPSAAQNVVITDTLPAGVTFVSGTGPGGALTAVGGVVTVNVGTLASGATTSFTVLATINANVSTVQTNTATVTTTTTDSNPANNTAAASTTVDPRTGQIAGQVFLDVNRNGVLDAGDTGIAGVTITLTGTNALGETINLTQQTNANGDYLFAQLAAGTYNVVQTDPIQFDDGADVAGTGAVSSNTGQDTFTNLVLGVGGNAQAFNFGELEIIEQISKRRFLASNRPS